MAPASIVMLGMVVGIGTFVVFVMAMLAKEFKDNTKHLEDRDNDPKS